MICHDELTALLIWQNNDITFRIWPLTVIEYARYTQEVLFEDRRGDLWKGIRSWWQFPFPSDVVLESSCLNISRQQLCALYLVLVTGELTKILWFSMSIKRKAHTCVWSARIIELKALCWRPGRVSEEYPWELAVHRYELRPFSFRE